MGFFKKINLRSAILAFFILFLFPLFALFKIESWPFTGFPMYSKRISFEKLFEYSVEIKYKDSNEIKKTNLRDLLSRNNLYHLYDSKYLTHQVELEKYLVPLVENKLNSQNVEEVILKKVKFKFENNQLVKYDDLSQIKISFK